MDQHILHGEESIIHLLHPNFVQVFKLIVLGVRTLKHVQNIVQTEVCEVEVPSK